MMELETIIMAGSDNVKTKKRHKYTLHEALQVVLEFCNENDSSDFCGQGSVYSEVSVQRL